MNNVSLLRNTEFIDSVLRDLKKSPGEVKCKRIITNSDISEYFSKFNSRNIYMVEMRSLIIRKLREKKMTLTAIGEILQMDHSNVTHYLNKRKPPTKEVRDVVKEKHIEWIINGEYPVNNLCSKTKFQSLGIIKI